MSVYDGLHLPNITEKGLDDKRERKQIMNSLMLLDEKLRYLFSNLDADNVTDSFKDDYLVQGKAFQNFVKDMEGNFSLLEQTADAIRLSVSDVEGNLSALTLTAEGISARVSAAEGNLSALTLTADSIEAAVFDGNGNSRITQNADMISLVVSGVDEETSKIVLTEDFLSVVSDNIEVHADIDLYGKMTVYKTSTLKKEGGSFGYMWGDDIFNAATKGIGISCIDDYCYVVAHEGGVSMTVYNVEDDKEYGAFLWAYDGCFVPTTKGKQTLGESTYMWDMLYADSCSCCTSDRRSKNSISYDMSEHEKLFSLLKATPFKMNNGKSGRYHIGFIAQDVEESMNEIGMDGKGFAGFVKTPVRADRTDETSEILDYNYGLRYEEFVALNTHMIQKLLERMEAVEKKLEGGTA